MKNTARLLSFAALATMVAGCAAPAAAPAPTTAPAAPAATEAPKEVAKPTEAPKEEAKPTEAPTAEAPKEMKKVVLQLQWVPQSQFAGYYAAKDKGYYADEGLDVEIKPGAVEIVPQQVVASGGADFGVAWLPKVLASREQGAKLVNIAQPFQRSGTLQIAWKDSNITKPEDWKGKKVGTWGFGNEAELFAAMRKVGIDPNNKDDVTIVQQPFDMSLLLNREVDAAQAMIYNEYAQVLEAVNPKTGELYKPEDLDVIDYNDPKVGTAMLQDGIFVNEDWIAKPENQDTAVKFLRATFKGWMFCRDNPDQCVEIVLKNGPTLGKGHMTWQLNEINALIWPSPNGIGVMDEKAFDQTADISAKFGITKAKADKSAYRTDLAMKALEGLEGDTKGADWKKAVVQVTKGGE